VNLAQRWLFGESFFRPANEPARAREFEVVRATSHRRAKEFVQAHHYSGSFPAARECFEVLHVPTAQTVGVAVFSQPINNAALALLPGEPEGKLELGRFVLLDWVPGNAETMVLGACFQQLRHAGYLGVVSYSDPEPRHTASGAVVHPGHVGIIYQAHNGVYTGRSRARVLRLFPDGRVFSERAEAKIKALEKGWEYAARQLVAYGARPLELEVDWRAAGDGERKRAAAWVLHWRERLTQPLRHPGNHRYVWGLTRTMRRHLPAALPYPEPPGGRVAPRWGRRALRN
jgi:hypothetical protein